MIFQSKKKLIEKLLKCDISYVDRCVLYSFGYGTILDQNFYWNLSKLSEQSKTTLQMLYKQLKK